MSKQYVRPSDLRIGDTVSSLLFTDPWTSDVERIDDKYEDIRYVHFANGRTVPLLDGGKLELIKKAESA